MVVMGTTTAARNGGLKPSGRRVSFSEPNLRHVVYPGEDEVRDRTMCWALIIASYFVRFYRLGIPGSVVFDEVRCFNFLRVLWTCLCALHQDHLSINKVACDKAAWVRQISQSMVKVLCSNI